MKSINWKSLLVSLAISLGAGVLGNIAGGNSSGQYEQLYQPPLAPPGWVFPIVWTILFILMGIAAYLIYESDSPEKKEALGIYAAQLIANIGWSLIFFGLDAYLLAFAWILLLWYFIFLTWQSFRKINKTAGWLLVPYLAWVTFATYLNLAIAIHYYF